MVKTISIFIFINIMYSQYDLSFGDFNQENKTLEIILNNEGPISGFQFEITGLELSGVSGGSAHNAEFSVSTSNAGIVVGFSFTGNVIPAGNNTLTYIHYESINSQITEINNIILSNPNAETISNSTSSGFIDHGEPDCAGNWDFTSSVDECGICNGPGPIYECGCIDIPSNECDCEGNIVDECGICAGDSSSCYFTLYLEDFDLNEQTLDIMITNPEDIAGFQFNLTGLSLNNAYGGLAEDANFSISTGANGNVLGFSFLGDVIPAQNEAVLLTTVSFSNVIGENTIIQNIILSNTEAATISNINSIGIINHGSPNCNGDYYAEDDTNSYGCCFDEIPDCSGLCNGNAIEDDCGICNGNGYSCLDCFNISELDCSSSPFCNWETDGINCSSFSSSSQCNAVDGCSWSSGSGGGGYGGGSSSYCSGGYIETNAFCNEIPCNQFVQEECSLRESCDWYSSTESVECISLSQQLCSQALECNWVASGTGYGGGSSYCSGGDTEIEIDTCSEAIIFGCTIDIANNYDPNANTNDGTCIFPPLGDLSFQINNGLIEIYLDCEYPVSDFIVDISGINITNINGGVSNNFNITIDGSTIIGTFINTYMPANGGLLAILNGEIESEHICFENSWITTSADIEYEAVLGECTFAEMGCIDNMSCDYNSNAIWQESDEECIEYPSTLSHDCSDICIAGSVDNDYYGYGYGAISNGDVNNDSEVDIIDITYTIEYVIGESEFNNMQLCVGDLNYSSILNITDIVMLIDYILGFE